MNMLAVSLFLFTIFYILIFNPPPTQGTSENCYFYDHVHYCGSVQCQCSIHTFRRFFISNTNRQVARLGMVPVHHSFVCVCLVHVRNFYHHKIRFFWTISMFFQNTVLHLWSMDFSTSVVHVDRSFDGNILQSSMDVCNGNLFRVFGAPCHGLSFPTQQVQYLFPLCVSYCGHGSQRSMG